MGIIVSDLPILAHLGTILDEHTIPVDELGIDGEVEAVWIINVLCEVQRKYKEYGTI